MTANVATQTTDQLSSTMPFLGIGAIDTAKSSKDFDECLPSAVQYYA
jgi:hypothetical protein